jgi:hypothetical protein
MSVQLRISAGLATSGAAALLGTGALLAVPAYADGGSPFSGRTEGGSLQVKSGDVIACAAVGEERVVEPNGTIHMSGSPGTHFTTAGGAEYETLASGSLEVSFQGASAVVRCPASLVPTTSAFVPKSTLAGEGGSVTGTNTATTAAGGALVAAGLAGGALVLRRRRAAAKG